MSQAPPASSIHTAADLVAAFGAIPLQRVRTDPVPGTATEGHVEALNVRGNALYELVGGTLVEKAMGTYESFVAGVLFRLSLAELFAEL